LNSLEASIKGYLGIGWKIFPVHYLDGTRCSCGNIDCSNVAKHPLVQRGFKDASNSIADVIDWLDRWPSMNVGLSTGRPSNVIVVDVDEKDDVSGLSSLKALEDIHGKLPPTLTQTTGGMGKHYFFKYPSKIDRVPSSVGVVAPGIDIRADGGYVILPPSNHRSGNRYTWNNFGASIADLPQWLLDASLKKKPSISIDDIRRKASEIPSGSRNQTLFYIASGLRGKHALDEEEIFDKLMAHNMEHCSPPLDESEVRVIANSASHRYRPNGDKIVERLADNRLVEINYYDFDNTEKGNAFRYYIFNDADMRYCYHKKRWFIYDGTRWEETIGGEPNLRAYRLLQSMKQEAEEIENEDVKKRYHRWISKSSESRGVSDLIKMAQPLMEIPIESMDMDPFDFNCRNGTFNLKSMELRDHDPTDHITFLANVEYKPGIDCPVWKSHLQKIFNGDKKAIDSFQRIAGYSLTELNPEQVMFIAWGSGKNGKSTTFNVLSNILGDYAAVAKAESFMKSRGVNEARNDLARLFRKRLVVTTEPPSGGKLNETLIKSATGSDKITARFLYQEFFEFLPAFKIFMNTNHRPGITESDEGIWRRIVMIPFDHVFTEAERDRNIEEKLIAESSGILNWLIDGYLKYIDKDFGGFRLSESMVRATADYRNFEDTLMLYVTDRCTIGEDERVLKRDLYADFVEWCESSGEEYGNNKKFGLMIHGHFSSIRDCMIDHQRGWKGIGLKTPATSALDRVKKLAQSKISEKS